jgi:3'-5' exoribonuclease Rv2179c-like domain
MRYWMDTEFIDDGKTIDLISIGIVCEDGRELYLQSAEFDESKANEWVKENVFPHLALCPQYRTQGKPGLEPNLAVHNAAGQCVLSDPEEGYIIGAYPGCYWRSRAQMRDEIKYFFNPSDGIELWGWCAGYDFVAFCQIFGTMMDLPQGYPHYIRDIQHLLDERGISDDQLPLQKDLTHNALEDARHIKHIWEFLNVEV